MMLAVFPVIPLSVPFAFISMKRMQHESEQLPNSQQQAASGILEYVGGIQTLKAFGMAGEHFGTLKKSLNEQRHSAIALKTYAAAPINMIGRFILNCGIGIVMLVGALLLMGGELSPFYYIAFLLLSLTIYDPFLILFTFIADLARSKRCGDRIRKPFEQKPLPETTSPEIPESEDIEFRNVSFGYGSTEVLHSIDLSFPKKSVTALVGSSGSVKSTITRLIARFWDASDGEIRMGGVPIKQIPTEELLSRISVVLQDIYLFHNTIAVRNRDLPQASAYASDRRILLLDQPTNGLDYRSMMLVGKILKKLSEI